MIFDTIVKIILVIASITILIYIFANYLKPGSEEYYCRNLLSQGVITEECMKYYSEVKKIELKVDENTTYSYLTGYIISCYNTAMESQRNRIICYEIIIKNESVDIDPKILLEYVKNYTRFNPDLIKFNEKIGETGRIESYKSLFIIFNDSYIIVWQ